MIQKDETQSLESQNDFHQKYSGVNVSHLRELDGGAATGGIVEALGNMPRESIITEEALAGIFNRHPVSIKRAVSRGELPPSTRLLGKPVWTAGTILDHITGRLDAAKQEAEKINRKISQLSP